MIVNKETKLRICGRKAPMLCMKEFWEKLVKKFPGEFESIDDLTNREPGDIVSWLLAEDKTIWKDLNKIEAEFENWDAVDSFYPEVLVRYYDGKSPYMMSSTGIPYIIASAGSDSGLPIVFMIYWDGKKFRGYVPTRGNVFNSKTKCELGLDEEKDIEFLRSEGIEVDENDPYGGLFDCIEPDINGCIEDFEARIEIIV